MGWKFLEKEMKRGLAKITLNPKSLYKGAIGGYIAFNARAISVLGLDLKAEQNERLINVAFNTDTRSYYIVVKVDKGFLVGKNHTLNNDQLRQHLCEAFKLDPTKKHTLYLDTNVITKANGHTAVLLTTKKQ